MPDKKPTIKDIAAVAGVSTQTISRVLNHRPDVAIATRERVLRTMARLQYSPNVLARRMRWATHKFGAVEDTSCENGVAEICAAIKRAGGKDIPDDEKVSWFIEGLEKGYFADEHLACVPVLQNEEIGRVALIFCSTFFEISLCDETMKK